MNAAAFFFLAVALLATPVMAQTTVAPEASDAQTGVHQPDIRLSGAELRALCASSSNVDYGMCAGYVRAVADLMLAESVAGNKACAFGLVRPQQLLDIVRVYMDQTPTALETPARAAVAQALARAFPCP